MVATVICCPFCGRAEPVVRHGTNRGGTARCRCKDCARTFTPAPNPRRVTEETERKILSALSERLSVEAVCRLVGVSKTTVYAALKKSVGVGGGDPAVARGPA
jgi:transposase-like protein